MNYFITLTDECNLRCRYCYGKWLEDFDPTPEEPNIDYSIPTHLNYNIPILREFCKKDPEPTLIFYGGEPALCLNEIREIMDTVPAKEYMIHTNGVLLDKLEPRYSNRLTTILVSMDGDRELTDRQRGKGTYEKIIRNLNLLQRHGYRGEVIARMTVTQETDIEKQVKWLLLNEECPFQSVHWQLDALFWRNDFNPDEFKEWAANNYNPGINNLIRFWVDYMEQEQKVLRIYPFIGLTQSLLLNQSSQLRCGAGWISFNIQTDGTITPCPAMVGMKDYYRGNIAETAPNEIKDTIHISEPCISCDIHALCGGRCLYANVTNLWGEEGFSLVCKTVRNLLNSIRTTLPRIKEMIEGGSVSQDDFKYPKNNSCEIIP